MICKLEEYAKHSFELSKTDQNGITLREHLELFESNTGKKHEDLIPPEFPYGLENLWVFFVQLSNSRSSGMNGPDAISFQEIESWSRLTGNSLSPWEVNAIIRLDRLYLENMKG